MKYMKKSLKNKKFRKKLLWIFIISLYLLAIFLVIYIFSYFIGYSSCLQKLNNDIDYQYFNFDSLFKKEINNITVYSDVDNFTRIENLMNNAFIYGSRFEYLTAIIYYQNKSQKNGYYEHISYSSCDGSYNIIEKYVELYRCDGSLIIRKLNASEKYSEKMILLHELGHYETFNNYDFQQEIADNYALKYINYSNGFPEEGCLIID